MSITYKNTVTADNVNYIRQSVGFRQMHLEQVQNGLNGSAFIVSAYDHDKIVGMARLIWDGGSVGLIHDIMVIPEYQMHGIENEMISRILAFLRNKLKPGFGIQVDVKAWNNLDELFGNLGFQFSTKELRGTPMHICLTNQIELTDKMFEQGNYSKKK